MPPIPVRNIGRLGIIADASPYDLPIDAWSDGNNVRFAEGTVRKAPVFRKVDASIIPTDPRFLQPFYGTDGNDNLFYTDANGNIYRWLGGTETNVTIGGFVGATSNNPFTGCVLAGVVYINRSTHVPYKYVPGLDATFGTLTGWNSTWRCRVLRKFGDYIIALNMTEGSSEYPSRFRWSNTNQVYQGVPDSWDENDTTKNAGFNVLAEADSQILDGLPLRNAFIIYTENQCWLVEKTGGREIFKNRKLYGDDMTGIINANCVVEVNGEHYVFGREDIYVHDGIQKRSIAIGRVKSRIFTTANFSQAHKFFVTHDPRRNEVIFCYVSGESGIKWPEVSRCNRSWAYNYVYDTWAPRDLPNVSSAAFAKVNQVATWATVTGTWETAGGTWAGQSDGKDRHLTFVSSQDTVSGLSTSKLLAIDGATRDSLLNVELDTECTVDSWVKRVGIDLDELQAPIGMYKTVNRLFPQVEVFDSSTISFELGGSLFSQDAVVYDAEQRFNPVIDDCVDGGDNAGGRYLSMIVSLYGPHDFILSGYDVDIRNKGRRGGNY